MAVLDRIPDLTSCVQVVVGRETMSGPKNNFDVFARGFTVCVEATAGREPGRRSSA